MRILLMMSFLLGMSLHANEKSISSFSQKELKEAATKIFFNETGGNKRFLAWWNPTEPFPSMGIGHFIWFPKDHQSIYVETFPSLKQLYREKNIAMPPLMDTNEDSPWNSYEEFTNAKYLLQAKEIKQFEQFLYDTREVQLEHIFDRLKASLPKMLEITTNKEHVSLQFHRMLNTEGGLYPLIDYVNFKGEGTKDSEKFNGEAWGLLQVLEGMTGTETGQSALDQFAENAEKMLMRRIENAWIEKQKDESMWVDNWTKRCRSYADRSYVKFIWRYYWSAIKRFFTFR
ncbi:MAG: hypothetical protein ACRCS8_05495 [Brevinema sp.]